MSSLLSIRDLTFAYHRRQRPVIDGINLDISSGGIYGLLGANGVGKSTLLYLIAGLLTPKRGTVELCGTNTRLRKASTLQQMMIVPEEFDVPNVRVSEYASEVGKFYPRFSFDDMASNMLSFQLDPAMRMHEMSMGQRKKAIICFALAANTPLLLMDEPTNGLDIPGKSNFRSIVASHMTDDRAIIISTHQVLDLSRLLDHVIIMNRNRVELNSSIYDITQKLAFVTTNDPAVMERAIYRQPSVAGMDVVMPNDGSLDTEVNLETLFQLVNQNPETIKSLFQ